MVNGHNSQGETRPDRQQTHLFGGRLLVGIPALPALPRPVVPVRRLPQHVPTPVVRGVPAGPAVQAVQAVPDVPLRLVAPARLRRPRSKHRRNALVRCRPAGSLDPADPEAPEGQAVPAVEAPVVLVAPAVGSRPDSPRISHPNRRPPRRRPPRRRADAAAR